MNTLSFRLCILACALGLAACGSGGGAAYPKTLKTHSGNHAADAKKAAEEKAKADKAAADARKAAEEKAKADKAAADARKAAEEKAKADKAAADARKAAEEKAKADKAAADARKAAEEKAKADKAAADAQKAAANSSGTKISETLKQFLTAGADGVISQDEYAGHLLSINQDGTVAAGQSRDNDTDYQNFSINGVKITLQDGKLSGVRALEAADFADAAHFNAAKPGMVGFANASYGKKLSYGVYTDATGNDHLFVTGSRDNYWRNNTQTAARYEGHAVFGKDGQYEGLNNGFTATANFVDKTINFTLNKGGDTLEFGAKIKGNTFQSEDTPKNGIDTRGGFFGYDDVGGLLNVRNDSKYEKYRGYRGAFGGTKVGR